MAEPEPPLTDIVAALSRSEAYGAGAGHVDVRETHVSVVFLVGADVYKLKKPVDFGFLDFTSLDKRRYFCQREVELNRRTSPNVYLGVVSIVPTENGGYAVANEDDARAVEYAVHMQRLPQESMLDERLKQGTATPEMLRSLGQLLAIFHRNAETNDEITATGDLEGVRVNVEENFSQTESYIGRTIERDTYQAIARHARSFMERRAELFHTRAREGFVRDCHGDLHAAQVCIEDDGRVSILDCIEFNERFRWGDTASDVAFMTMDLEARGHLDLGRAFLDGYMDEADDPGLGELLPFYQSYRAYVRGKVEGFRLDQPGLSDDEAADVTTRASAYFDLAARYARTAIGPHLILVGGLMGTGKTTVTEGLARRRGFAHLSSDAVRKELAGVPKDERHFEPFGQGIYSPEFNERTYIDLIRRAQEALTQGHSVVVDASFSRANDRARFRSLAKQMNVPLLLALCELSDDVARERLEARVAVGGDTSDGRWELYAQQQDAFELPADFPARSVLRLNTGEQPDVVLDRLIARLDDESVQ